MSDEIWSISVKEINNKTRLIQVSPTSSTDRVIEKIAKLISDDTEPQNVQFVFGAQTITYGSEKKVKDINIVNGSSIIPVFRLQGGIWTTEALKSKKYNLQPLPGFITVTTSEEDEDMITYDNDPTERRAKMPCGHVIGPASMTSFCHSILSQGLTEFNCPQCRREWPYFLVRHVACLSGDEMRRFEEKLAENYISKSQGIIQCPGCRSYCFREDKKIVRMHCIVCAKTNKARPDFCWYCLKDWKGRTNDKCGHADCGGVDKRIQILATCPMKKIRDLELPSMRGCPSCGLLIEHKDACKHMTCTCKHAFCFSCLRPMKDGKWECSTYGNECGIAARQTTLPGC